MTGVDTEAGESTFASRNQPPIFVIQRHAARRDHFDFRLEVDDTLVSWAVPKGPSTDPRDKRLAVRVEDHPLSWADFEGVIRGQYGAGAVQIWDRGTYRNLRNEKIQQESNEKSDRGMSMSECLADGKVEVWLEGEKLVGGWALVHAQMGGDPGNWLLIKMRDDRADARRRPTSTEDLSVVSGRSLSEIAASDGSEPSDQG